MADSVKMIEDIVAHVGTYPKTNSGEAKIEDASALAVAIIGIVAPEYQTDIDSYESLSVTAQSLADQRESELILLRGEAEQLRTVVAQVKGHLANDDILSANAVLSTIP